MGASTRAVCDEAVVGCTGTATLPATARSRRAAEGFGGATAAESRVAALGASAVVWAEGATEGAVGGGREGA